MGDGLCEWQRLVGRLERIWDAAAALETAARRAGGLNGLLGKLKADASEAPRLLLFFRTEFYLTSGDARAVACARHGSIAAALAGLEAAGAQPDEVRAWLGAMTISPVLTAHPTEVQRKSIQDCEREVSRLLQVRSFAAIEIGAPSAALEEAAAGAVAGAKASAGGVIGSSSAVSLASMALVAEDGAASAGTGASAGTHAPPLAPAPAPAPAPTVLCALTGEELADAEARLFRHMITLWQTAMLRLTKLKVTDEVNNAIEFHAITFLVVVPRLNASPPAAAALPTNGAAASAVPPPPVAADALTPCPPLTDVGHAAMSTRRCGGYLCQR